MAGHFKASALPQQPTESARAGFGPKGPLSRIPQMASALSGRRGGFALRHKRLPEQGTTEQRVKVGIRVFAKYLKIFRHGGRIQTGNPGSEWYVVGQLVSGWTDRTARPGRRP